MKPRCNNEATHSEWTAINWPCPLCAAITDRERKQADEDRLADKIAQRVAELLRPR